MDLKFRQNLPVLEQRGVIGPIDIYWVFSLKMRIWWGVHLVDHLFHNHLAVSRGEKWHAHSVERREQRWCRDLPREWSGEKCIVKKIQDSSASLRWVAWFAPEEAAKQPWVRAPADWLTGSRWIVFPLPVKGACNLLPLWNKGCTKMPRLMTINLYESLSSFPPVLPWLSTVVWSLQPEGSDLPNVPHLRVTLWNAHLEQGRKGHLSQSRPFAYSLNSPRTLMQFTLSSARQSKWDACYGR